MPFPVVKLMCTASRRCFDGIPGRKLEPAKYTVRPTTPSMLGRTSILIWQHLQSWIHVSHATQSSRHSILSGSKRMIRNVAALDRNHVREHSRNNTRDRSACTLVKRQENRARAERCAWLRLALQGCCRMHSAARQQMSWHIGAQKHWTLL